MFQIFKLERPDMASETVAVDLRTDLVVIESASIGWLTLVIYSNKKKEPGEKRLTYGNFKTATVVSPCDDNCPLCGNMKKVWVREAGVLTAVNGSRQKPSDVRETVDCPSCTPQIKIYDLPQPLGAAIAKAFGETECANLYQGDPVAMVRVIEDRLRHINQRAQRVAEKVTEAYKLLA